MYWLHFIGQKYWTPASFKRESSKYGVSRRISAKTLKDMAYGDIILLAYWDGRKSIIFGKFKLTTVYYTDPDLLKKIDPSLIENKVTAKLVNRGCGSYVIVSENETSVPIQAIAEASSDGFFMIGGEFEDMPRIILKKVPHRMGFRPFDLDAALSDVHKRNAKGEPVLYGQYYLDLDAARVLEALTDGVTKMVRVVNYVKST